MAQQTALSPTATPGKPYSFSAKTAAAAGPHTGGPFTELSVIALPGQRHSFSAKTAAAAPSGDHTGLFTELSVLALPGMRHSFTAKTAAEVSKTRLRRQWAEYYPEEIKPDDKDMMEIIIMAIQGDILN